MQVGAMGLGVSSLSTLDSLGADSVTTSREEQRNIIFIVFGGGMGAYDSFDFKADAPVEIQGPFEAQETKTGQGVFSDQFPCMAAMDDKFGVIRSRKGQHLAHRNAFQMLAEAPDDGHILDYTNESATGIPYVSAVTPDYMFLFGEYLQYMRSSEGITIKPKLISQHPTVEGEYVTNISNLGAANMRRLRTRDSLRKSLNNAGSLSGRRVEKMESFYEKAMSILQSDLLKAFREGDPRAQKARNRRYGDNPYGKLFSLAGQLADPENGNVKFTTINTGEWDHHWDLWERFDPIGKPLDQAMAALIEEYGDRLVIFATGEMGRSPKFEEDSTVENSSWGRDHSLYSASVVAGPNIKGGTYLGETVTQTGIPTRGQDIVTDRDLIMAMLALSGDAEVDRNNVVLENFYKLNPLARK